MEIRKPKDYGLSFTYYDVEMFDDRNLETKIPFDLNAQNFLKFAKKDLERNDTRDIINGLSNVKRAIENRIDCLLYIFGYYKLSKKWNFPKKIKKLNDLNIIAPRILTKINKIRNLLEHEYRIPKKEKVEDAFDVAGLFLESTRRFIQKFCFEAQYYNKKYFFCFKFEDNGLLIGLSEEYVSTEEIDKVLLKPTDSLYDDWVKFIINLVF